MKIRKLEISDAKELTQLSNQLGYHLSEDSVSENLQIILNTKNHFVFGAELENNIIGYIHAVRKIRLTSTPFFEIVSLVVDENHRQKGGGKSLIREIINLKSPNEKLRVRCQIKRKEAHLFYQKLGFNELKEQKVFELS